MLSLSFQWLMYGQLKISTEAQMVDAQGQGLAVRAIQNHIYGMFVPLNCSVSGVMPNILTIC